MTLLCWIHKYWTIMKCDSWWWFTLLYLWVHKLCGFTWLQHLSCVLSITHDQAPSIMPLEQLVTSSLLFLCARPLSFVISFVFLPLVYYVMPPATFHCLKWPFPIALSLLPMAFFPYLVIFYRLGVVNSRFLAIMASQRHRNQNHHRGSYTLSPLVDT